MTAGLKTPANAYGCRSPCDIAQGPLYWCPLVARHNHFLKKLRAAHPSSLGHTNQCSTHRAEWPNRIETVSHGLLRGHVACGASGRSGLGGRQCASTAGIPRRDCSFFVASAACPLLPGIICIIRECIWRPRAARLRHSHSHFLLQGGAHAELWFTSGIKFVQQLKPTIHRSSIINYGWSK